ncbi:hypothetical protein Mnod_3912 [Methylobacterium nodulans ORS 2060]|uniref:Integration host factor subunit alpha n=1 Tax=Methylobacterium nodulans (strain LMG 21967 / CNCM I-2342 / ORS 2060) TaxID=460265 RepID=B8ISH2_METNO|nr:hypothetical protein Mnod_3912 [Methylobacterium nodulans ORS 2060]
MPRLGREREAVRLRLLVVRDKGKRVGRNPKTGVEVAIAPRRVMVFKPSNVLKAHVTGGLAEIEDDE